MAEKKKRAAPSTRVDCDLVLTDPNTGEPWLDRRGQWVEYRVSKRWGDVRTLRSILASDNNFEPVTDYLCSIITAWSWDDEDGNPLPCPPTTEVLASLEADEVTWLINSMPGNQPPK